jgi:hypothetical protein
LGKLLLKLILLGCAVFASLTAVSFLTIHAGHDCTYDDQCPVCMQLRGVLDLLKLLNTVTARLNLAAGVLGAVAAWGDIPNVRAVPASPVALKVRMNN